MTTVRAKAIQPTRTRTRAMAMMRVTAMARILSGRAVRVRQSLPSENCQTEQLPFRYHSRSVENQVPCQLQGQVLALRSESMRVPQVRLQEQETAMTTKSSEQAKRPSPRCRSVRGPGLWHRSVSSQALQRRMGPRGSSHSEAGSAHWESHRRLWMHAGRGRAAVLS